jgi:1,4-dihydroxy-2-naphthoyl-CoA synthase
MVDEYADPAHPPDAALCEALAKACLESADYVEGRRAFMEKRRPDFRGV